MYGQRCALKHKAFAGSTLRAFQLSKRRSLHYEYEYKRKFYGNGVKGA